MSPQSVPSEREWGLMAVLLFPVRAVERARGWGRVALLVLYVVIAVPIGAVVWRRGQLARLPDVGDTFGVSAAGASAVVPDEQNAFVVYRLAAKRFRDMNKAESESFAKANLRWSAADAVLRGWVEKQRDAVSLLRSGSERPEASLGRPGSAMDMVAVVEQQELVRRLSWIGNAALFEAGRLRAEGDLKGAWGLLKAAVRVSRDMERAVPTVWCRGTAMTLIQYARGPVEEWAKDSRVSVASLRRALDDLSAAEALTPPISDFYRMEYQLADASLADVQALVAKRAERLAGANAFELSMMGAFLRGEPERSRRVLRLLAANDLAWCDRLAFDRPPLADARLRIYEADPAAPAATRAMAAEELAKYADSVLIDPIPPWRTGALESWEQNVRRSLAQLKVVVAVAMFTREVGRAPASPAEAARQYFPIPGDSADRDEAEPVPLGAGDGARR